MWCDRTKELHDWFSKNKCHAFLLGNAIPGVRYVLPYGSCIYIVYKIDVRYANHSGNRMDVVVANTKVTAIIADTARVYEESFFLSWFPNLHWNEMD